MLMLNDKGDAIYPDDVIPPKFIVGEQVKVLSSIQLKNRTARQGDFLTISAIEFGRILNNQVSLQTGKKYRHLSWGFDECCEDCRRGKPHITLGDESHYMMSVSELQEAEQGEKDEKPTIAGPTVSEVRDLVRPIMSLIIPAWKDDILYCDDTLYHFKGNELTVKEATSPNGSVHFPGRVSEAYLISLRGWIEKIGPIVRKMKETESKIIELTRQIQVAQGGYNEKVN